MAQKLPEQSAHRLALIRKLHDSAIRQAQEDSAAGGLAILPLQDAVELFLGLLAEINNVDARRFDFLAYWPELEKKNVILSGQISMKRLNAARVNLKHLGLLPNKNDIEEFIATTTTFLIENSEKYFGIDFRSQSLLHMVQSEEMRELLQEAEGALEREDYRVAVERAAVAVARMRHAVPRILPFGRAISRLSLIGRQREIQDVYKKIEELNGSVYEIMHYIEILYLGLDVKKYFLFKEVSPIIQFSLDSTPHIFWTKRQIFSFVDVRGHIDFAIEYTLAAENRAGKFGV